MTGAALRVEREAPASLTVVGRARAHSRPCGSERADRSHQVASDRATAQAIVSYPPRRGLIAIYAMNHELVFLAWCSER